MCDRGDGELTRDANAFLTRIPCPARLIMVSAVKTFSEPGRMFIKLTALATPLGILKLYPISFPLETEKVI